MTILAFTGHRNIYDLDAFDTALIRVMDEVQPTAWIQGMADGADLRSAKIAINLKVPVISALPWQTHYESTKQPEDYRFVLDHSEECYVVTEVEEYVGPWLFFRRNEWMIDEGDKVVSWWDGREKGGTHGAILYANKTGKLVRNVYA